VNISPLTLSRYTIFVTITTDLLDGSRGVGNHRFFLISRGKPIHSTPEPLPAVALWSIILPGSRPDGPLGVCIVRPLIFACNLFVSPPYILSCFSWRVEYIYFQIAALVCGKAMNGTENDSDIVRSASLSTFISSTSSIRGRGLDVDIHRYIVGITCIGGVSTTSSASPSSGVSTCGAAPRFVLDRDCFFSNRFMVSALAKQVRNTGGPEGAGRDLTFSSSSFFSVKFLRFRAVSSRFRAISSSVSGFFFRPEAGWSVKASGF